MAEFPALPLFTDAYLADTIHLTAAQHGAYMLMLMAAWRTKDCALPNDDEFLARVTRMDKRTWLANKTIVLGFWTVGEDAKLRQGRLYDERKFVEAKRDRNSQAGKASALKRQGRGSTDVQPQPNGNATPTPTPTPQKKEEGVITPSVRASEPPGAGALKAEADARRAQAKRWPEFRATYPKREGSQSWPAAEKKYIALVASGVAEQTIIDGAHRYSDSLRASGSLGTRFVKHASAWLNQKGWEDEYLAGTGTGRRPGSDLMDAFDNRIREAEDRAGHRAPGEGNGDWAGTIDATFTEI